MFGVTGTRAGARGQQRTRSVRCSEFKDTDVHRSTFPAKMDDEISRRSSISQRAKSMVNMVTAGNPRAAKCSYQAEKMKTVSSETQETSYKPAPDDYLNRLYAQPYSMTSRVFKTFCETKSSYNSQYVLETLNNKKLTEDLKEYDTAQQENSTVPINKPITPNPECISIDLTCKEVMPLQDDLESYQQLSRETKNSLKHSISQDVSAHFDYDSDDSVKDKDYVPSDTDSDISTNDFLEVKPQQRSLNTQKNKKISQSAATTKTVTPAFHDTNFNDEKRTIFHGPRPRRNSTAFSQIYKTVSAPILIRKRRNTINDCIQQKLPPHAVSIAQNMELEISNLPPRKRKKYNTTVQERQLDTKVKKRLERGVKEACNEKCLKKCTSQWSQEDRKAINEKYWDLTLQEQHLFVDAHTAVAVPKRKITGEPMRKPKRSFFLKTLDGIKLEVCKIFFLTTLGYKKTNDRIVHDIRKDSTVDKRGKHQKTPAVDRDMLTRHVESFNPLEPHYRREHAPLRRYLPSDINVVHMHKDFNEKFPDAKVSYELYRKHIKKMNISFTRLGNEECETCEAYNLHKKQTPHDDQTDECTICVQWTIHHEKYKKARQLYTEHKDKKQEDSTVYFSGDLEKVIMLPRLESFKSIIFCQRLVAYNQTFAPLGKITTTSKPLTVLWHDAIRGRKQEDIMSAYYQFFIRHRDVINIHLWLDNCSAQNKNWLLYSMLVHLINSEDIATQNITLYYFEPGHTFMSCDQVHHQVELAMKKRGKLYDFNDFEEAVASINNSKVTVKSLTQENFMIIPNYISDRRIQNSNPRAYIKNICQVYFERNSFDMKYKNNFDDEYINLRFMNEKYLKNPNIFKIDFRMEAKGIEGRRKDGLIEKLTSIIPPHKMSFWRNLPVNNNEDVIATTSGTRNKRVC